MDGLSLVVPDLRPLLDHCCKAMKILLRIPTLIGLPCRRTRRLPLAVVSNVLDEVEVDAVDEVVDVVDVVEDVEDLEELLSISSALTSS